MNAAELVNRTIEYLEYLEARVGVTSEFIDELCLNRSYVDDLVRKIKFRKLVYFHRLLAYFIII